MSKARTIADISSKLDDEFTWRKRELIFIYQEIQGCKGDVQVALIRAAIVLLYAHWEGFVKNAAELFLKYVESRKHKIQQVTFNLAALALRKQLDTITETNKYTLRTAALQEILSQLSANVKLTYNTSVSAKSNLNNEVFTEIAHVIGLNVASYTSVSSDIDGLVNYRNKIAHGEYLWMNVAEYKEYSENILQIMSIIKTDIENSCVTKSYLIP